MFKTLATAAVLLGAAAVLSGQTVYPGSSTVGYFSNNTSSSCVTSTESEVVCVDTAPVIYPDATLRITNVGTSGGDLCADIYVFDPNQELSECCSCPVTPDGLLTLSVHRQLTSNPLTGVILPAGVIKVVSSSTCNAASPKPAVGIQAWATHIQNSGSVTETGFSQIGLSSGELGELGAKCAGIKLDGSGAGICYCGNVG
jgi:hypothetical protein